MSLLDTIQVRGFIVDDHFKFLTIVFKDGKFKITYVNLLLETQASNLSSQNLFAK